MNELNPDLGPLPCNLIYAWDTCLGYICVCNLMFCFKRFQRVAQWLEAQTGNHEIESANPTGGAKDVLCS